MSLSLLYRTRGSAHWGPEKLIMKYQHWSLESFPKYIPLRPCYWLPTLQKYSSWFPRWDPRSDLWRLICTWHRFSGADASNFQWKSHASSESHQILRLTHRFHSCLGCMSVQPSLSFWLFLLERKELIFLDNIELTGGRLFDLFRSSRRGSLAIEKRIPSVFPVEIECYSCGIVS